MELVFIVLGASCLLSPCSPSPSPEGRIFAVDAVLKTEIEQAAAESRHLADELAGMLDRLEIEEDRDTAVNAAVRGEHEEVEAALKEMVDKIEKLAEASEETSTDTVSGLVKKKRVKEQELRRTLEQLEVVASQIEDAADTADTEDEVNSIEKVANLLQSISDKVAKSDDEDDEDEEVFRRQFEKQQSRTGLELNGIAAMIKSLEKVTKDLKEDDDDSDEDDNDDDDDDDRRGRTEGRRGRTEGRRGNTESRRGKTLSDFTESDFENLGVDQDTSDRVAELLRSVKGGRGRSRSKAPQKQRSRGGKQIDIGLENDAEKGSLASTASRLLDAVEQSRNNDDDEGSQKEETRSGGGGGKGGSGKYSGSKGGQREGKSEEEDMVTCEDKAAEDRVRVCLPKTKTQRTPLRLPSAKVEEAQICVDVGKTICNETSAVLSREVCTYEYAQADVLAPAQSADLTFQPRVEKLGVTRCHVGKEKQGYREVDVEKCVMEYIDAPYILPDLAINVDDFLQLQLPEPNKRCTVFQYELPEVVCGESIRHSCVNVAHLKPYQVTEYADTASLAYGGSCNAKTLSQNQQICTTEKKVTHHRQPKYSRF